MVLFFIKLQDKKISRYNLVLTFYLYFICTNFTKLIELPKSKAKLSQIIRPFENEKNLSFYLNLKSSNFLCRLIGSQSFLEIKHSRNSF